MAENRGEQGRSTETAELNSVQETVRLLVKSAKAHRIYPPNNPVLARFITELAKKLETHLAEYGDLRINIDTFAIRFNGVIVHENLEPKESLPFRMHSDGIRSIIFSEGMEEREVFDFIGAVGKERFDDVDSDIVTMLWTKDLPHLIYVLAEDSLEFETGMQGEESGGPQQDAIQGIYSSLSPETPHAIPYISQQILYLTEQESKQLRMEREIEERTAPLDEVMNILFCIMKAEKSDALFDDFADIAVRLAGSLIENGEIGNARILVCFLNELSGNGTIPTRSRESLSRGMGGIFTYEMVASLRKAIDGTGRIASSELGKLIRCLASEAVFPLCELLAQVERRDVRYAIVEAVADLGGKSPALFFSFLQDERWYLVRNVVCILARIASPEALEPLSRLIGHPEPRVRKEVLLLLEAMPDPRAKSLLVGFLRDASGEMRLRAIQGVALAKTGAAFRPLADMIAAKEFEGRDFRERVALSKALGAVGPDRAIPIFRGMLMKKYRFSKAREKEAVICAVAGLRKAGTEAALMLLREAENEKTGEAGAIISNAVRTWGREDHRNRYGGLDG